MTIPDNSSVGDGSRRPNLVVVHGEKGGVGKSFAASLAASRALRLGLRVHVIECDSSVPDVGPRFIHTPGATVSAISLNRLSEPGEALSDLLGSFEDIINSAERPDIVIINAPAGASEILDNFAEIFKTVTEALSVNLTVGFLVDESSAVLPAIEESLRSGLLSIPTTRRALIYAGWRGKINSFPVANSSARADALRAGLAEFVFPALTPASVLDRVRKEPWTFYQMLQPPVGLSIVERSLLALWLAKSEVLADWLIGVPHDE